MSHTKFHLAYFTKFGAVDWPKRIGQDVGADWASGHFFIDQAVRLEQAMFDFILFEDSVCVADKYGGSMELELKNAVTAPKNDPLPLLPLLAHATSHIGFIATASTSFYPPYLLARTMSTIDSLSGGRTGWNIVTSSESNAAQNFGMDKLPPTSQRYDIADEYVELACKLWDSWEEGAVVADPETGVYVDHNKVHLVNHAGEHFRSRGPLNTIRSPQVRPVLCQAGASSRGRDFAAKNAEVVLGMKGMGIDTMKTLRDDIRGRMTKFGRSPDDCKIMFLTDVNIVPDEGAEAVAKSQVEENAELEHVLVMLSSSMDIDLSKYDLDGPIDQTMEAGGHTSVLDQLKLAGQFGMTLRDALTAKAESDEISFTGTPEHIAEKMMAVMDEVGGDGFLITGYGQSAQLPALTDRLVPALQKAGAVRTKYSGSSLRDLLFDF